MCTKRVLLTSGLIFLNVSYVLCGCRVVQILRGTEQYNCDLIKDLEEYGQPYMLDVDVHHDASLPPLIKNTFRNIPNTKRLGIRNSTNEIGKDAFIFLHQINIIIIDFNDLRVLAQDSFRNLSVTFLDLSYNMINEIKPGAFVNLPYLQRLQVRSNRLTRVKKGIFTNLPVEILSLSKNRIYLIEDNAFDNLENLVRLQLDGNRLTNFQPEAVMNFAHNLQILWLHNNSFEEISRDTLKGLRGLKLLNLQDNKISRILLYTFENVMNLQSLVLSNNSLEEIDEEAFPQNGMPKLAYLYIDHNRLSFLKTSTLGRLTGLKATRLAGNPWKCVCFDLILLWLSDHDVKLKCDEEYFNGEKPVCVASDSNVCTYTIDHSSIHLYFKNWPNTAPKKKICILGP